LNLKNLFFMKKINIILMAIVAMIIATSCTIDQTIDYNADMSGTNNIIIDMSGAMEMMGGMMGEDSEAMKGMDMKEGLGELEESFGELEGVSNLKMIDDMKSYRMGFSYDFEDTKALNNAMKDYLDDGETAKKKKGKDAYKQKGKKLLLNFDDMDTEGLGESLGDPSMMGMLGMMDYNITINLPEPVKSIDNKVYMLSEDRKTVSANVSFEDMFGGEESLSTKIKW